MDKECSLGNCPVETAMKIIGGKYKAVILWHLMNKTLGMSLVPILDALCDWGKTFMNTEIGTNVCTK